MNTELNNKETLIYLAGCLDCDGYFTIVQSTYRLIRGRARYPESYEQVGLKQTSPDIVNLLKDTFGGTIFTEQPSAKHGKLLYGWRANRKIAIRVATKLLPYLRIKDKQAGLMIELRKSIERMKARAVPNSLLPQDERELRARLVTEVRALNDIRTKRPKLI